MLLPKHGLFQNELQSFLLNEIQYAIENNLNEITVSADNAGDGAVFTSTLLETLKESYPHLEAQGNLKYLTFYNF